MESRAGVWSSLVALLLALPTTAAVQREDVRVPRTALDLTPLGGYVRAATRAGEVIPVLAGDKVLVNSTLRLFALSAESGELLWSAGPPQGWSELDEHARAVLFEGIDWQGLVAAPAAGERVAVAALQLPLAREQDEDWQGIEISKPLPERRLFAFELATGRALWNHAPPEDWDCLTGPFERRMRVMGSPLVAGERAFVACTIDGSSIDYHVACYELATGELVWKTFVSRGQIERSMFGQAVREFAAAPLVLARDAGRVRVLVQTGLGVIAALDLGTGAILWRASYPQIELPKARSYHPPARNELWRTAPPVVVDGVVLATPDDSADVLALDLQDGRVLWSAALATFDERDPKSSRHRLDHLIGARDGVLYFGGDRIAAFAKPGGLRSAEALVPLWSTPVPDSSKRCARAWLSGDTVLVPGASRCAVLKRADGEPVAPLEVTIGLATIGLLPTDEAVFAVTPVGFRRLPR